MQAVKEEKVITEVLIWIQSYLKQLELSLLFCASLYMEGKREKVHALPS